MDIKLRIFHWENAIKDNPSVLVLLIGIVLAVGFLTAIFLDGYIKARKRQKRRRGVYNR